MQVGFNLALPDYIRLYAFLSHILPFADAGLEKLYQFARLLNRRLPVERERLPVEIQQQIDIDSYRVRQTSSGSISLLRGKGQLDPQQTKGGHNLATDAIEPLSAIIQVLNARFGTDFSEEDRVFLAQLEARLDDDPALSRSVKVNPPESARLTFDHVAGDRVQDMIDSNFKFYKQITDDSAFAKALFDWLFQRYLGRVRDEQVGESDKTPVQAIVEDGVGSVHLDTRRPAGGLRGDLRR